MDLLVLTVKAENKIFFCGLRRYPMFYKMLEKFLGKTV